MTREERFMEHVSPEPMSGCWLWTGECNAGGYGISNSLNGKRGRTSAHRSSYIRFVGPVPDDLEVDHKCNNPACVNPAHLEPVTSEENYRRKVERRKYCKYGHELSARNVIQRTGKDRNRKSCLTCARELARRQKGITADRWKI